jgi:hypothetical protein
MQTKITDKDLEGLEEVLAASALAASPSGAAPAPAAAPAPVAAAADREG